MSPNPVWNGRHARSLVDALLRLGLFFSVEAGAEMTRLRLQHTHTPFLSTGTGAILVTACWAYVAHRRLAFRSVGLARPAIDGLAPFLAASWLIVDLRALADRTVVPSHYAILAWPVGAAMKYWIVRRIVWPTAWSDGDVKTPA